MSQQAFEVDSSEQPFVSTLSSDASSTANIPYFQRKNIRILECLLCLLGFYLPFQYLLLIAFDSTFYRKTFDPSVFFYKDIDNSSTVFKEIVYYSILGLPILSFVIQNILNAFVYYKFNDQFWNNRFMGQTKNGNSRCYSYSQRQRNQSLLFMTYWQFPIWRRISVFFSLNVLSCYLFYVAMLEDKKLACEVLVFAIYEVFLFVVTWDVYHVHS